MPPNQWGHGMTPEQKRAQAMRLLIEAVLESRAAADSKPSVTIRDGSTPVGPTAMSERETYLGDGLFASFDGYQVRLRAPRENGDHEVFLDALTFQALLQFLDAIPIERPT
jgi:hypothetical protein